MSMEEARAAQDRLLGTLSTTPLDDKINAAARLLLNERYKDCILAYRAIAVEHPEKLGTAEGQIGACQFFLGDYPAAIVHYERAKELGEDAEMMDDNIQEAKEAMESAGPRDAGGEGGLSLGKIVLVVAALAALAGAGWLASTL